MEYIIKGGLNDSKKSFDNNKEINNFLEDCNNIYKEFEYLIGFVNEETIEPKEEFDKLIYNINKILCIHKKDDCLSKLIELINNNKDKKQIARIIFVLLYERDLMNKENFGESLLINLIDRNIDDIEIFINEYKYVYNKDFDDDIPSLEDLSGGKMYKNDRNNNKK
jgi:hypothetical protein